VLRGFDTTDLVLADQLHTPVYNAGAPAFTNTTDLSVLPGSVVVIMDGRGTGQYRFLAGVSWDPENPVVHIDHPFDVVPDNTSWLVISKHKGRLLFVENTCPVEGLHWAGLQQVRSMLLTQCLEMHSHSSTLCPRLGQT
jgi:hypothetical protein